MATWDRYLNKETGFEIKAYIGANFQPVFYCDDPTGGVYTTKAPAAKLIMTPVVQFINTNIAWDVSQSSSASGTIDTWDLNFGGGGAANLSAQDWSTDPKTGNIQYTSTGTYIAALTMTDTGGNVSQASKVTINIVDTIGFAKAYIVTSDTGVFTYSAGGSPATANTGLSGGDLNNATGKLNPHYSTLAANQHHHWAVSDNGLVYSTDGRATNNTISYATMGNPTNTAGDASPPTSSDLVTSAVCFDPQDQRRVYALLLTDATWNMSNDPRAFLYWTNDYGATWTSFGIGV